MDLMFSKWGGISNFLVRFTFVAFEENMGAANHFCFIGADSHYLHIQMPELWF